MSKNWDLIPLKNILTPVERSESPQAGKIYRQLGVRLWGLGAYERESIDGIDTKYKNFFRVEENDIVINKIWARNGSVAVVKKNLSGCYVSNEFPCFIAIENKLFPQWFYWFTKTKSCWEQCDLKSRGTSRKNRIRPEKFLEIEIPLPPLEEQRRIVEKIERLAEKIEEVRSLRLQTIKETEALLNAEIYKIFQEGQQKGWQQKRLGDYVESDCYGTSEKTHSEALGIPILRMGNIQNGRLDISDLKYLHIQDKDRDKFILKKGDILVNRTNSAELVGKCAVFTLEKDYGFASYIIRVRLDTNKADPFLVAKYINSPLGRAYMFNERKQMTGQANINAKKLKALPICLPDSSEQKRIVEYLDRLQSKIEIMKKEREKALEETDALLPSILDKAFKGEL